MRVGRLTSDVVLFSIVAFKTKKDLWEWATFRCYCIRTTDLNIIIINLLMSTCCVCDWARVVQRWWKAIRNVHNMLPLRITWRRVSPTCFLSLLPKKFASKFLLGLNFLSRSSFSLILILILPG